jgi:hypothetical protein
MFKGFLYSTAVFITTSAWSLAQSSTPWKTAKEEQRTGHQTTAESSTPGSWAPTAAMASQTPTQDVKAPPTAEKAEPAPMPKSADNGSNSSAVPVVSPNGICESSAPSYGVGHWVNFDYLLWWTRDRSLPPLVTSGNPASQGILGQPGTQILYGGPFGPEEFGRSGFRFMAGTWLGCEQSCGIEFGGFFFPQRDDRRAFGTDLCTFLARPFFNLNECIEFAEITSLEGLSRGTTTVRTPLEFWGAEVNGIHQLCCGCACRVDLLTGFRYLDLDESVVIDEWIRVEDNLPPEFSQFDQFAGATVTVNDRFATRNRFYGGQIGLDGGIARGPWQVGVRAKLGLGVTRQTIDISGGQTILFPNGVLETYNGGLLALASNIGRYSNSEFSVVPELNVNLGYRLTDCVLVYMGYSFLYWSRVVRPGDQIDRVIDVTQIPNFAPPGVEPTGIPRPGVPFAQTDFWAQGLNFGIEFCW